MSDELELELSRLELDLSEVRADYAATYSVPSHPDRCPLCRHLVQLIHLSQDNDAIYTCAQQEVIIRP